MQQIFYISLSYSHKLGKEKLHEMVLQIVNKPLHLFSYYSAERYFNGREVGCTSYVFMTSQPQLPISQTVLVWTRSSHLEKMDFKKHASRVKN